LIAQDGGSKANFPTDDPGETFPKGLSDLVDVPAFGVSGVEVFDDLDGSVLRPSADIHAFVKGDAITLKKWFGGCLWRIFAGLCGLCGTGREQEKRETKAEALGVATRGFVLHQRSLVADRVKEVRWGQRCATLCGKKGRGRLL
jgi:hypothetical protein